MNTRTKLARRIDNERKRAEALYQRADAQAGTVARLETILAEGDESHWLMALDAFLVRP